MELNTLMTIFAILILAFGVFYYIKKNGFPTFNEIAELVREPLLKLFLYAEKQNWTGPEKMEWCIDRLLEILPIHIKIDEITLRNVAQYLYEEYREFILDMLSKEEEEPK